MRADEFLLLGPEIVLGAAGLQLLVFGSVGRGTGVRESAVFSLLGLGLALGLVIWIQQGPGAGSPSILGGSFVLDGFAFFWKVLLLISTAVTVLLSVRFIEETGSRPGVYLALVLLAATGWVCWVGGPSLLGRR